MDASELLPVSGSGTICRALHLQAARPAAVQTPPMDVSLADVVHPAADSLPDVPVTADKPVTATDKQQNLQTFFRRHHRTESADQGDLEIVCSALLKNKCGCADQK